MNVFDLRRQIVDDYRGRQSAEVALLVRRIRALLAQESHRCIGTSATMASGNEDARREAIARVATTLFGTSVLPSDQQCGARGTLECR